MYIADTENIANVEYLCRNVNVGCAVICAVAHRGALSVAWAEAILLHLFACSDTALLCAGVLIVWAYSKETFAEVTKIAAATVIQRAVRSRLPTNRVAILGGTVK
jgi:hypothetical protein